MDLKQLQDVLENVLNKVKISRQIADQAEDFTGDELMEFDREKLVKIADSLNVNLEDVKFTDSEETLTENTKEFLLNQRENEDREEFLGVDNPDKGKFKNFLEVD